MGKENDILSDLQKSERHLRTVWSLEALCLRYIPAVPRPGETVSNSMIAIDQSIACRTVEMVPERRDVVLSS